MTKALSPLIVAAHIHHPPRTSPTTRNGENASPPLKSGTKAGTFNSKKRRGRVGPKTPIRSGEFKAPDFGTQSASRDLTTQPRVPLAIIDNPYNVDTPERASTTSRSSSPEANPTAGITAPKTQLANDKVKMMKDKGNTLEVMIEGLEDLVYEFKGRVRGLSQQYETLKDQIDHVSLEFEALENDHLATLDVLDQEISTSNDYHQKLRNAEKEIFYLYKVINNEPDAMGGFSQAKHTEAIYDRYK